MAYRAPARLFERFRFAAILQNGIGEGCGVSRGDKPSVLSVFDDIGDAFKVGADGGQPTQPCLQHDYAEPFHISRNRHVRHDEEIGGSVHALQLLVGQAPEEPHPVRDAGSFGSVQNAFRLRTFPGQPVMHVFGEPGQDVFYKPYKPLPLYLTTRAAQEQNASGVVFDRAFRLSEPLEKHRARSGPGPIRCEAVRRHAVRHDMQFRCRQSAFEAGRSSGAADREYGVKRSEYAWHQQLVRGREQGCVPAMHDSSRGNAVLAKRSLQQRRERCRHHR